ncbi:hypothetical protein [Ectobacillus ponti]|uniref:Uncharacterized protein n=1 Tax=Ectobacillus ponti TaxID=2961894 RepID=A0AA41XD71_9BACI|nr:hypothetical protein [Ectobacillus ponti]MCP8970703.1 hypothetical protein [Ectobacillus ponti]
MAGGVEMEPRQPGNTSMPDFRELHDRVIAEPTDAPQLVIKTNLDPKDSSEENPYYRKGSNKDALEKYFEGK